MPRKPADLLTAKEQSSVVSVLMAGADLRAAADYVGRSQADIRGTAEADAEFQARLDRAEPHFELKQLGNITQAAMREQYWRAAAWLLERKFPSRYAKPDPEALAPAKVRTLLENLVKAVLTEVKDPEVQANILQRLRKLLESIQQDEKKS